MQHKLVKIKEMQPEANRSRLLQKLRCTQVQARRQGKRIKMGLLKSCTLQASWNNSEICICHVD